MVANVLIISDLDQGELASSLKKRYYAVYLANNFERASRIMRNEPIDVVLFAVGDAFKQEHTDFFHIFRQLCYTIPIIGVVESFCEIPKMFFDDVVLSISPIEIIIHKINVFLKIANIDVEIAANLNVNYNSPGEIAVLLHDTYNFIDADSVNAKIVQDNSLSSEIMNADVFIINCEKNRARRLCAELRLSRIVSPIIFTYHEPKEEAFLTKLWEVGCTDIVPDSINSIAFSCQVNSLIKFKKLHELYIKNVQELSYCSVIDATTGVYNRSFFEGYIKKCSTIAYNTAIFMIDVDKFKQINDRFGHAFADIALKNIAKIIKKNIRSSDVIARYGGDEFIIVMQNVAKDTAVEIANRILNQVADFRLDNAKFSISIGLCCDHPNIPAAEAISEADQSMYFAKQSGGNAVRVCG